MRKIREVLRLKFERGLGHRAIGLAAGISKGSVADYLARAEAAGLAWAEATLMSDAEVERRLFRQLGYHEPSARVAIDFVWVHGELRRTGVTLQLLWREYNDAATESPGAARPYQYSQFCDLYAGFRDKLEPSMRQTHRAGEKAFVDYSGKKPAFIDRTTGEVIVVELFVMVLGASNYTFAEATRTQQLGDFIASNVRAFDYFGCERSLPHASARPWPASRYAVPRASRSKTGSTPPRTPDRWAARSAWAARACRRRAAAGARGSPGPHCPAGGVRRAGFGAGRRASCAHHAALARRRQENCSAVAFPCR